MEKRLFDLVSAFFAIVFLSPLMLLIGFIVRSDGGPALFRQDRVGKNGVLFTLYKFRSMVKNADKLGAQVTASHDSRITEIGRFLRRTKLDELPQLINVFLGDLSIVGPRPEVPFYVQKWSECERAKILSIKPGITDYATLLYNQEQEILAKSNDPEKTYLEQIMPHKLTLYCLYVEDMNFFLDLRIATATLLKMVGLNGSWILRSDDGNETQRRQ